jgi:hypothetical protein
MTVIAKIAKDIKQDIQTSQDILKTFYSSQNIREFFIDCPKNDIRELICQLLIAAFKAILSHSNEEIDSSPLIVSKKLFESVYTAAFAT